MVFNYGPKGISGEHIDFNPGIGGGKFDPLKNLEIQFNNEGFSKLSEGTTEDKYILAQDQTKWELAILSSCQIQCFKTIKRCDLFLVAGGKPGQDGSADQQGAGGNGGGLLTKSDQTLDKDIYNITIGSSNENTIFKNLNDDIIWTAITGQGKAGSTAINTPGTDGDLAWGDANTLVNTGWRYGAGGGHGATHKQGEGRSPSTNGGSIGLAGETDSEYGIIVDGHGGGVSTDAEGHQQGWDGHKNTGQGGGGGRGWYNGGALGQIGGAGGSGIVIIRGYF